jgi:DNA-binding transcriptional MerR regulator
MDPSEELLKIGDFARRAETNLRTLRYYEEIGLISPAARSAGGFRYYRPTDVNRVRLIRDLSELGMQLGQIAALFGDRAKKLDREERVERVRRALEEQDRLLAARIGVLEAMRGKVGEALGKLTDCSGCGLNPSSDNNFCEPCQRTLNALPDLLSALF